MEVVNWKIDDLIGAEYNPRQLSEKQFSDLQDSIKRFGFQEPVIVNTHKDRKGIIISGHQRTRVAKSLGIKEVPCVELNLTLEQEKELNIRMNKNTGDWDWDVLANEFDAEWLMDVGFEDWQVVMEEEEQEAEEDDFDTTPPEEPKTVLGDLYEIGEHRLLCGDSTCSDTVRKLMNGEKADMVFTDPPYLMDFKGNVSWDEKNGTQPTYNSKHGSIKNDKMSKKEGEDFLDAINSNIKIFVKGSFYITFYRLGIDKYFESLNRTGLQYRSLIIWNKLNHTLSNSDYMSRYEPIFYGWVDEHNFYGGNNGMDIWDIKRTEKNELHPTMKPIPLCEKAINDGSKVNNIVLDLFLGSGSTMVASHQLKRKCYGIELDPKYCDVIVKRMINLDSNLKVKRNGKDVTSEFLEIEKK